MENRYFLLVESDRKKIERIMLRLYTERRMDANEMRDTAHLLSGVLSALLDADPQ